MNSSKYSYNLKHAPKKTPCRDGKNCKHFPHCAFFHSPENTPDCPFMGTLSGCTNLSCPYKHPDGFVHACIFGANCKRNGCPYTHPKENVSIPSYKPTFEDTKTFIPELKGAFKCVKVTGKEYSNVFNEKDEIIGILDGDHFVSFMCVNEDTIPDVNAEWDKMMNDFNPEDDPKEFNPDDYELEPETTNFDDYETDPEFYPEIPSL